MISLSDHQLSVVMTAAAALDVEKRDAFLQKVVALVSKHHWLVTVCDSKDASRLFYITLERRFGPDHR
jgi:hypothetical protein